MQSSWQHVGREWRQKRTIVFALTLGNWQLLWPMFVLLLKAFSQFVSSRCPRISQYFAKVCKFVPVMEWTKFFPRIVHCSDTACSLLVHFLFNCTCLQAQTSTSEQTNSGNESGRQWKWKWSLWASVAVSLQCSLFVNTAMTLQCSQVSSLRPSLSGHFSTIGLNGMDWKKPMTWSWPSRKEEHVEKKVTTMQMFLMQPVFWKISK